MKETKKRTKSRPTLKDKLDALAVIADAERNLATRRRAREKFILGLPLNTAERWSSGWGPDKFVFDRRLFGLWFPKLKCRRRTVSILVDALDRPL